VTGAARAPIRKAVFPVGGLGTRFLPATKALPKEMLPIVDKPLIEYAVDEARAAGIKELVFVTGRGKSAITNHFDIAYELERELEARGDGDRLDAMRAATPEPGEVAFVRQVEPLGLGHAVWCARNFVAGEPFAVILADELILGNRSPLEQMVDLYNEVGGNILGLVEVPDAETFRYGIVSPGERVGTRVEVLDLVEKPAPGTSPSNLAIAGRYVLQPGIIDHLAAGTKGAGGEIQLTDALAQLLATSPFWGQIVEGRRFDCGTKIGYLEATVAFALRRGDLGGDVRARLRAVLDSE
jgi:UTP--glucose-1-phosphate uridylyltransferase